MGFVVVPINNSLLVHDGSCHVATLPDAQEGGPHIVLIWTVVHRLQPRQPAAEQSSGTNSHMTDSVAQHCKKCNGGEPLGPVLVQTNLSRARCLSSWSHIGWWRHLIRGSTLCRSRGGNGEVSLTMAAMWSGRDPQQPPSALTNPSSANGLTSVNGKETVSYEMSDFFCIRGTWGIPADICDYELASRIQLQIRRPDMHWRGNRVCDSITAVLFAETVYCMSDVQSRGWRST